MAERFARAFEKSLLAARDAQRVGADDAHARGMHVAQALAEAFEAADGARGDLLVEAAIGADAGAQAHHLAHAVDDDQLAVRVAGDYQVKAVGSEVDCGQYVWRGAGSPTHALFRPQ